MGAYTSTYTSNYPSSAGLVEEGYSLPTIVAGVEVAVLAGRSKTLDGIWQDRDGFDNYLLGRTQMSVVPAAFVRVSGVWSLVKRIPATYEKLIGGGHEGLASLTDLNELLAAGLITQGQYDTALETV